MKKALTLFIPLIIFCLTIAAVEFGCRILISHHDHGPIVITNKTYAFTDLKSIEDGLKSNDPRTVELAQWLSEYPLAPYFEKNLQVDKALREEPAMLQKGLTSRKHLFNRFNTPNLDDYFIKTGTISGKEKYRIHVKTNDTYRRITPGESAKGERNILFYGCSFTFGEGVEADETIPAYSAQFIEAKTYNLGVLGQGPSDILRNLETHGDILLDDIPDQASTVVYTFIDDHIRRTVRTSQFLSMLPEGHKNSYFYRLKDDDQLTGIEGYKSSFWDFYWFRTYFGRSSFVKLFKLEVPWITQYHFKLLAKILIKQKNLTKKRLPQLDRFIVAVFPGESFYIDLIRPYLEAEGVTVLDYSKVAPSVIGNWGTLPFDGHPSGHLYRLYSYLLSKDLEKLGHKRRKGSHPGLPL